MDKTVGEISEHSKMADKSVPPKIDVEVLTELVGSSSVEKLTAPQAKKVE